MGQLMGSVRILAVLSPSLTDPGSHGELHRRPPALEAGSSRTPTSVHPPSAPTRARKPSAELLKSPQAAPNPPAAVPVEPQLLITPLLLVASSPSRGNADAPTTTMRNGTGAAAVLDAAAMSRARWARRESRIEREAARSRSRARAGDPPSFASCGRARAALSLVARTHERKERRFLTRREREHRDSES